MSGNLPASGMHANTCVPEDQGCYPVCANPTPVCKDMLCQACTGDGDCPAEAPYCDSTGSCMECLPDGTGCGGDTPICSLDGVCVAGCENNNDCAAPTPICREAGYCVECDVVTDCSPGEICTPAGNCEPCTEHGQCDSGICDQLDDPGQCVPAGDIVYVSNTEFGSEDMEGCGTGASKPCQTIAYAVGQAQTQGSAWIHVDAGDYTGAVAISGGQTLRIVGQAGVGPEPGVTLEVTALATAVLDVQGAGTDVYVEGLSIQGGMSATVNCRNGALRMYRSQVSMGTADGVSASGCELHVERVLVRDSGGIGVSLDNAPFTVRNTVIMKNGGLAVERRNSMPSQPAILEFSTIVGNNAGNNAGLSCDMPLTTVSHIILSNGANSALAEVGGCFTPDPGAMAKDYMFIRGRNDITGLAADGYHLTAGSSAVNKGMVPAPAHITEDFDGEPRPNGVIDIGADEFHPLGGL